MKYLFSNHGFYSTTCDDDYVPAEGEVVFEMGYWPTEAQLVAAFPGRLAYIEQMRIDALSKEMREKRDGLMTKIYDAGTQMIRRELETAPLDPAYEAQLIAKRTELHAYARLLQAIPDQAGFPDVIAWPTQPTAELE